MQGVKYGGFHVVAEALLLHAQFSFSTNQRSGNFVY
jgi:hypothetical protein